MMTKAIMNILVQAFVCTYVLSSFERVPGRMPAGSHGREGSAKLPSRAPVPFCFPTSPQ